MQYVYLNVTSAYLNVTGGYEMCNAVILLLRICFKTTKVRIVFVDRSLETTNLLYYTVCIGIKITFTLQMIRSAKTKYSTQFILDFVRLN